MEEKNKHNILITENLSIGYKTKHKSTVVADQINIELKQGELIGLVGANGIGKSTLLRTLTSIQQPLDGTIHLNKKPLQNYSAIELAKVMSLVLTEQLISKNLSVYELVALGRQPYTNWVGNLNNNDITIINKALEQTNLSDLKQRKCLELSDGQLQKVMIARALAQDTNLIILDEPTTHLDMYHQAYVLKLLKKLTTETNKSILFATHEINLALQLCDKIIIMEKDKVIAGSPKELIEKNAFSNIFPSDLIYFDNESVSFKIRT